MYIRTCVCVRACVRACLGARTHIAVFKYFAFVSERFLAPCFIELLMFYCKMYSVFYVNDEPEGNLLYTETIKLYLLL